MQPSEAAAKASVQTFRPEPASTRPPRHLALGFLTAIAIIVRMLCLSRKPFWFDECFSVEVARLDWRNFFHLLWWREANMSLYYVLLRIWLDVGRAGESDFLIRSLSVLISAATLPAIYWLARLLYDRRVALIAAALFTLNAYSVRYAQEARSYALFLLLATVSSGFLIAFLREPTRHSRVGYVLASILSVYAHFYALLLIVTHWLALRWLGNPMSSDDRRAETSVELRRAWKIIGIAVLPLLIFVAKTGAGPIRWIPRPGARDVIELYARLCGGSNWVLLPIFAAACIAGLAPFEDGWLARDQRRKTWRAQFLLVWLFFPVVLTALLSLARPVFLARYMIFCLPALLILVAAGLARLRSSWLLAPALTGILFLCLQGVLSVYGHDFDNERDASGAATDFILNHTRPGDAIVFHIAGTRVPYEFFRSVRSGKNTASAGFSTLLGPEILFPHHAAGLDYRDFTGKPTADFLRTTPATHPRVWVMLMNNGPPGDPDPTTVMLTNVLSESFPRLQCWQFPKVEVRLYSKQ